MSNIKYNSSKKEIRCSREEGRNPTSVCINTENLLYKCFSTGNKGNIYTLVMEKLNLSFPEALRWITRTLKLDTKELKQKIRLPFGGFYKNIIREADEPELFLTTYNEEILQKYHNNSCSKIFSSDGINFETQQKYKVGYDSETQRITIPQWSLNGELMGIMGRLNDTKCEKQDRWLPIIPCSRSLTLYGYNTNYYDIQKKQVCLILESEKSVMQMDSMGLRFGLATCTNTISDTQAKYIKSLMVEKVIIAYDEGVDEDVIRTSAEKLLMKNPFLKNSIGYIYDANNDVLPLNSKASPTDLGFNGLKELMRDKIIWM